MVAAFGSQCRRGCLFPQFFQFVLGERDLGVSRNLGVTRDLTKQSCVELL